MDERYQRATANPFFAGDAFGRSPAWRKDAVGRRDADVPAARPPAPGAPEPDVPDGRIHHWVGAIFVPGVTVTQVVKYLVAHAGQESGSYDDVIASRC